MSRSKSNLAALVAFVLFGLSGGLGYASCTAPECAMAKVFMSGGNETLNGLCYEFEYPFAFSEETISSASEGGVHVCDYPGGSKWRSESEEFCHNCTCPDHGPEGDDVLVETCLYTTQPQDDWQTTTHCSCQAED